MTPEDFEHQLRRDGYLDIKHRFLERGADTQPHSHPFDTRLLILEGEMTIVGGGNERTYRAGEVLEIAADTEHMERYAPECLKFVAGLRHKAEAPGQASYGPP